MAKEGGFSMPIRSGTQVASWQSNFGQAKITVKERVGGTFPVAELPRIEPRVISLF